jgi:hypothetical protein
MLSGWQEALHGNAEAQNMIGMYLSFRCMNSAQDASDSGSLDIDWEAARFWFEQAAESGHWAANNNLGVMYLNGYGAPKDPKRAFEYLMKASNELSPITLGNLEKCYRDDEGCDPDIKMDDFIAELKAVLEDEENTDK